MLIQTGTLYDTPLAEPSTSFAPTTTSNENNSNQLIHWLQEDHPYCKGDVRSETPVSFRRGLLRSMGILKSVELTPKAKRMYHQAIYYKRRANALNRKNLNFKEKLTSLEKVTNEKSFLNLTKNFSNAAFHFFKRQVESFGKNAKGIRFSLEDKILGLALYKQSPSAYKLLSKIFVLPSRVTLQKMLSRIPISAGIHDAAFSTLKAASKNMKAQDKYCVLLFDEMSIEPNVMYNQHSDEVDGLENFGKKKVAKIANHVQVYMLRGIAGNWKQPVGYFFVNGGVKATQIKQNIIEIVRKAKAAGMTVVATVCDQGTNNRSAIDSLVTETKNKTGTPHYVFDVDENRIVPLFDVPHLLKALRNILLTKDIHFINKDGKKRVAKWEHIQQTWYLDGYSGDLRAMPKITEFHVIQSKIKKMKVSVAAQVFSRSVAAAMNLLISNNKFGNRKEEILK
ncbi:hypothetical protein NQ317_009539 [Molorchus minor]|uniref:Transposase n=1 Tax=Molorchus minor TaxID=1323400 RepID=A0ABQ9J872_9CUCU|nr:hypothetical protein NQ317_009539 [Molorchus minor]